MAAVEIKFKHDYNDVLSSRQDAGKRITVPVRFFVFVFVFFAVIFCEQ